VKTDSLFYRIFLEAPAVLLQLVGLSPEVAAQEALQYDFRSVELKQTASRIDGVLLPQAGNRPVWFVEVQFQADKYLYHRLFSELTLFIRQNPDLSDWRFVIIFPRRKLEPQRPELYQEFFRSDRIYWVFLEDLPGVADLPLDLALVKLITEPKSKAIDSANGLLDRAKQSNQTFLTTPDLIDLIKTIMVYKFEKLSREEIEAMLGLADLKQTRVYQEARTEGREEGLKEGQKKGLQKGLQKGLKEGQKRERQELVQPLLEKLFGELDESLQSAIVSLIALSPDRFLSLLLALSQPVENRKNAIVSILQSRFNVVPESVEQHLSRVDESNLLELLKKAIVSPRLEDWPLDLPVSLE